MRKTLFEYTQKFTSEQLYDKLPSKEKETLKKFYDYMLISAGESRTKESIRECLRLREVVGVDFDKINLEDLRYFLLQLKKSSFSDLFKNKVKGFIQKFLRWKFKNWSERFDNFEDVKFNSGAQRKRPINFETLITEEEIEKMIEAEKSLFWKTFLKVQYTGGLRTLETRSLEWSKISFNDDGFTVIKVSSKKNVHANSKEREIPLSKGATYFLMELKKQQKSLGISSRWIFPSPRDPTKHISKAVNLWFKRLSKKVIGREVVNYNLRHRKATELKSLIKNNKMSMDNATEFMGHSEKQFNNTYSHMDKKEIVKIMQEQIYGVKSLPDDKKHKLEREVEKLKEKGERQNKEMTIIKETLKGLPLDLLRKLGEIATKEKMILINEEKGIYSEPKPFQLKKISNKQFEKNKGPKIVLELKK